MLMLNTENIFIKSSILPLIPAFVREPQQQTPQPRSLVLEQLTVAARTSGAIFVKRPPRSFAEQANTPNPSTNIQHQRMSMLRFGVSAVEAKIASKVVHLQHRSARYTRVLASPQLSRGATDAHHQHAVLAAKMRTTTSMGVAVVGATAAAALGVGLDLSGHEAHSRAAIEPQHKKKWHLFDQIGSGAFGTVRIGMHEESGEVAAIKIVEPDKRNYLALEREISALKLVKALGGHSNIIDLKDVYVDGRKVCLVTELARGGELFDHIVAFGAFTEDRASAFAREIGGALGFLHRHGIVHKDIKPENILMSSRDQTNPSNFVKLADFGSAGPASMDNKLDDVGTSAYLPPELLQSGICTTACDMWALGCVLYIVLSGSHPFDLDGTATDEEVEERIKNSPVTFDFAAWDNVSSDAKDLISKLLTKDPGQRLTADQLLLHPWIVSRGPKSAHVPMQMPPSILSNNTIHPVAVQ
ncbi:Camk protein kinase, partial [Globisporangium splendens]